MSNIDTIRSYVVDNFLFGDGSQLTDTTSFLEEGIVDSTGILELVSFLEETYGITVEDDELIPDNMDSVSQIDGYLTKKLSTVTSANN
ncbi:MAG: acyl carrier protein [Planctomycetes bacterium]|nr:acyl carrier protein [Planctomycetota bacterium]